MTSKKMLSKLTVNVCAALLIVVLAISCSGLDSQSSQSNYFVDKSEQEKNIIKIDNKRPDGR